MIWWLIFLAVFLALSRCAKIAFDHGTHGPEDSTSTPIGGEPRVIVENADFWLSIITHDDETCSMRSNDGRAEAWRLFVNSDGLIDWEYSEPIMYLKRKIRKSNVVMIVLPKVEGAKALSASLWAREVKFFELDVNFLEWFRLVRENDEYLVVLVTPETPNLPELAWDPLQEFVFRQSPINGP
jgi:hypothetical protein